MSKKQKGFLKKKFSSKSSNLDQATKSYQLEKYHEIQKNLKDKTAKIASEENIDPMSEEGKGRITKIASNILDSMEISISEFSNNKSELIKGVVNEIQGLGPLEPLIADSSITEIMVNGKKNNKADVFIEKKGKMHKVENIHFRDHKQIVDIIQRILTPLNKQINIEKPMVDARLLDGSRVNAVIPPIAIDGPCIDIRKFPEERLNVDDLINFGSLTPEMARFIKAAVIGKKNIIVSGGTGAGKTTILNVISNFIPKDERIFTIEDSAELQLGHKENGNLVRMESRSVSSEGTGEITIQDCLINTLRQNPDRIIVGECRSIEAYVAIQAMNTGHDGSLTTVHANGPLEALMRLEGMILTARPNMPLSVVRTLIGAAVNIVVQVKKFQADGSRKTIAISEVKEYNQKEEKYELIPIFEYKQTGFSDSGKVVGEHIALGNKPTFFEDFKTINIDMPEELFKPSNKGRGAKK